MLTNTLCYTNVALKDVCSISRTTGIDSNMNSPVPDLILNVTEAGIMVSQNGNIKKRIEFDSLFGQILVDSKTHHLGIAISNQGILSATVDLISLGNTLNLGFLPDWEHK